MKIPAWGFSLPADKKAKEHREDVILAVAIGTSLLISTLASIWIVASTVTNPPRYHFAPMPNTLTWNQLNKGTNQ